MYCQRVTETDVVDGYEMSWHVYISRLCFYVENKTDIISSYKISLLDSFIVSTEGTYGKFTIAAPRYVGTGFEEDCRNFSSALYGNRILRVPRYRGIDCKHIICIEYCAITY